MILAVRLAARELRAGLAGLRVVIACLALGVAAIAAVGTLREGVAEGLARDGARILGGDVDVLGGSDPLPDALRSFLTARGARLSEVVTLRSMLIAPSGERLLVELKAVDKAWPLVGAATLEPAAQAGAYVDPLILERLHVKPGDALRLGKSTLKLAGTITDEPDRIASPSIFGPRTLIPLADLAGTGLLQPGAIVEYHLRAKFPDGTNIAAAITSIRTQFGERGWRIRTAREAAPGVGPFIDRTGLFMTMVGLTALLVGGIGVANGTRAWLEARARTVAILRCLGAPGRLVFTSVLIQVMALACIGIAIGLVAGALLPLAAGAFLRDVLPVPPVLGPFLRPLALAAAYGLLTAATFSLWPLGRSLRISGGALFRDALIPQGGRPPLLLLLANAVLAAGLVGLTVIAAEDRGFALWFCAAAAGTLLLFRLGGLLLVSLARALPHGRRPWLRLGLGNLYAPGSGTALMLVSVGLGLATLAAVASIQGNLRHQVEEQLPDTAPSFFFIDIQNDQLARFRAVLAADPAVQEVKTVPSLRARLVSVNGVPADQVHATPETAWALRGDRGLTYAAAMPDGTRLVAGHWWASDYSGPPLASFDANLAKGWGIGIGDTIRVNVLGRDIDLKIASLRDIAWRTLGINFTLIASPGLLDKAPHAHIATVRVAGPAQAGVLREVTDALPNVSGIRVADVLRAVGDLLGQVAGALAATGSLTLAAGGLVLGGAIAAGQRRRIREAVILKTLGATRGQIRLAWLVEFGVIGATAGLVAAGVGTAAGWGVMRFVMQSDWEFLPGTIGATVVLCVFLMLGFGFAGTEAALRAKAAPWLRNE